MKDPLHIFMIPLPLLDEQKGRDLRHNDQEHRSSQWNSTPFVKIDEAENGKDEGRNENQDRDTKLHPPRFLHTHLTSEGCRDDKEHTINSFLCQKVL